MRLGPGSRADALGRDDRAWGTRIRSHEHAALAAPAFTYSVVKQPCAPRRVNELHSGKRISAPVLLLGAGIRPTSCFFLPPRFEGGWRADKAHCPDYSTFSHRCSSSASPLKPSSMNGGAPSGR